MALAAGRRLAGCADGEIPRFGPFQRLPSPRRFLTLPPATRKLAGVTPRARAAPVKTSVAPVLWLVIRRRCPTAPSASQGLAASSTGRSRLGRACTRGNGLAFRPYWAVLWLASTADVCPPDTWADADGSPLLGDHRRRRSAPRDDVSRGLVSSLDVGVRHPLRLAGEAVAAGDHRAVRNDLRQTDGTPDGSLKVRGV